MTLHEMDDAEFLVRLQATAFDAVGSQEFTRLLRIASRNVVLTAGVLKVVDEQLREVAEDPVRLPRAQEFARMKIEELFR